MPIVSLEREESGSWSPVLRGNGSTLDSRGPEMVIRLEPNPPYGEPSEARTYEWVLWLGLDRVAQSDVDGISGVHRLRIQGRSGEPYSLVSEGLEL
jgi:hypothetical protein